MESQTETKQIEGTVRSSLYYGKGYRIDVSSLDFTVGKFSDNKNPFYSFRIGDMQVHIEASRWQEFKEKMIMALENPVEA